MDPYTAQIESVWEPKNGTLHQDFGTLHFNFLG